MKKISLKTLELTDVQTLSRNELKNVLGGLTGSALSVDIITSEKKCDSACTKFSDCPSTCPTCKNNTTSGGLCKKD